MSQLPEQAQVRTVWPEDVANRASFVNQVAVNAAPDDAGRLSQIYLLLGHVGPPIFASEDSAREFIESGKPLEVDVRGAYVLTLAQVRSLHQVLAQHLEQVDKEGGAAGV